MITVIGVSQTTQKFPDTRPAADAIRCLSGLRAKADGKAGELTGGESLLKHVAAPLHS
jgi:hypothetical protein